mmetsp:Transcript_16383/g.24827  ORF Transcript_16383/g.24827 Transcript_16383/m.24827 type:complete len:272 (+) Transcript_16383:76-891(+)
MVNGASLILSSWLVSWQFAATTQVGYQTATDKAQVRRLAQQRFPLGSAETAGDDINQLEASVLPAAGLPVTFGRGVAGADASEGAFSGGVGMSDDFLAVEAQGIHEVQRPVKRQLLVQRSASNQIVFTPDDLHISVADEARHSATNGSEGPSADRLPPRQQQHPLLLSGRQALKAQKSSDSDMMEQCLEFSTWAKSQNLQGAELVALWKSTCEPAVRAGRATAKYATMCSALGSAVETFSDSPDWTPEVACEKLLTVFRESGVGSSPTASA